MRRSLLVFAAFIGSLLALAPAAQGAYRWGVTAINVSPQIASDNDRYVAFQRRNGMPVVLDTRTRELSVITGAWHCQPRDIGGGRVLLICPHGRPKDGHSGFYARTASLKGGKAIRLVKARQISDAYEIGRYWVPVQLRKPLRFGFLNWRTGALRRYQASHPYAFGAMDLDHPQLGRADIQTFTPDVAGRPLPRRMTVSVCRSKDVVVTDWRDELRLWWDSEHSVLLGRGHLFYDVCQWHQSIRIGTNWVTWSKGRAFHAYNFRTGRRFNRRFKLGSHITPIRDGIVIARRLKRYGKFYKAYRIRIVRL